jgi:nitroreductase
MNTTEAIQQRRSIKKFADRALSREEIQKLLDAAVLAPNHRLTQPWRFYVLGPDARHAYGLALGNRKAKKIEDPDAARTMRDNVAAEHRALPGMVVFAVTINENDEIREEDYAAVMMAIENFALAAVESGFGTHLKTGAVMADPAARAAAGVTDDNLRIVGVVNVGVPAEVPAAKNRQPSSALTTWMA